ncbi:MAG: ribose-phosphate pyrophosphokinase [Taibaiella sp.]|nr:ribose-phosphate pyrophosphokinase [Taibaiella sp.]
MYLLNLDSRFNPVKGNVINFEKFVFSGGEPHIKIQPGFDTSQPVLITTRIRSFEDMGFLVLAVDALRRMQVKHIAAFIPYFPAARQDRLMVKGEPLSVKVNAQLINSLGLDQVYVFDPHSEVTPALLDNVEVIYNYDFIRQVIAMQSKENLVLISPDGGALKKIYKLSEQLGGIPVVECSKVRDVVTGKLKSFTVYADDLAGKNGLIVDDICDGGGTFIGLAQSLKEKGVASLDIAVSHGIFSKGTGVLRPYFDKIYTTNSFNDIEAEDVLQLSLDITKIINHEK